MARISELEKLATELVGDGKSPNLYFVTNSSGHVIAIFVSKGTAVRFAEDSELNRAPDSRAYLVEDRKSGECWTSDAFDLAHAAEE